MRYALPHYDTWKTCPPEYPDDNGAIDEWIENAAEQLVRHKTDIQFKRQGQAAQGLSFEAFALAVDEFAMERLGMADASPTALGRMVIGALLADGSLIRDAVSDALHLANPVQELYRIADELLRPMAHDGVIADQEDRAL